MTYYATTDTSGFVLNVYASLFTTPKGLPADVMQITQEQYKAFWATPLWHKYNLTSGYVPDVVGKMAAALADIDVRAGEVRKRISSPGAFVADEYRLAWEQSVAWDEGGRVPPSPETVQSWADARFSGDAVAALADILATRAIMDSVLEQVRRIRLFHKEAVRACTTIAEMDAVILAADAEFNAIGV